MSTTWEYKVLTLKRERRALFAMTAMPPDAEATRIINREGAQGWELVSVVLTPPTQAPRLFFKRPR